MSTRSYLDTCAWKGSDGFLRQPIQCSRRIHVPEDGHRATATHRWHFAFQQFIEYADTACLYNHVGSPGHVQGLIHTRTIVRRIDVNLRPLRRIHVLVLLPFECIGLIERDAMP